ncbi:MAG: acyl-CoA thioesterase [Puniceicoccales bacterium]|jgi:acyl-CoA thioester hydrolase|nr:acyl-CoA thioesterase [Puniceicoccales bacterium]
MISASTEIRVRYAETDAMGIAYHGNYLPWFEVARVVLLDKIGLSYKKLEDDGFLLPVLEANLRYLAPARFDDILTVTVRMEELPRVRIRMDYTVHKEGSLLTTGHTLHAFMNRAGQAIKPPAIVQERFISVFNEK